MTYLLISLPFVLAAAAVWWTRGRSVPGQCTVTAVVVVPLVALTVTFDDLMIRVGLVGYDPAHHTGLVIGVMPVEDLAYAVVAGVAVPAVWPGKGTRR